MDFLNRAFTQFADLFKSLSPGARLASALLLVVIVVSLAYLFQSHTAGADAYLMGGEPFPPTQMPTVLAAFAKADLSNYEIEGNKIKVPRGQQSAYMGALADDGALPPNFGNYLDKALSQDGPFSQKSKLDKSFNVGKQHELQNILRNMKGIENASVIYDKEKTGGFAQRTVSTASVSVKPFGSQPLDKKRIRDIRNTVASAFAGLKPENVSVTDFNGRSYASTTDEDGPGNVDDDLYFTRKAAYEEAYQEKVSQHLSTFIPGVVVTVNVDLVTDTEIEETKTTLDPKGVIQTADESSSNKMSKGAAPLGRPGLPAQQPGGANQPGAVGVSASGPEMVEETNHVQTTTAIPTMIQKRKQIGLTPQRVTVAVAIPSNYYDQVWVERNPAPAGHAAKKPDAAALEEIKRKTKEDVQNAIVGLLPVKDPTKDPFPQVEVTSFTSLAVTPLPVPTMQDQAMSWLGQYWTTLGMGGLALVSLLMLRSVVRSAPAAPPLPTTPSAESGSSSGLSLVAGDDLDNESAEAEEPTTPRARLRRRTASGPSLREELTAMVKEDPDSAVAVLRNWIGAGA